MFTKIKQKIIENRIFKTDLNVWETIVDFLWYNRISIFLRHVGRFLKRLPKWIQVAWKQENWDYEYLYDLIELKLKELYQAQLEDTWHVERETKRRALQIKCTLEHLDRFRNWTDYYEWPDPEFKELENGCYTVTYNDPEAEQKMDYVHKMEEKHYKKFWYMLEKYHKGWWT